ncbi:hypothetical protein C8R45DRAFT_937296 [Mycena sanguinolenta]|nr:hypothetical protein C8R45DRAFT_937296 [Mycena sanguinolenta]
MGKRKATARSQEASVPSKPPPHNRKPTAKAKAKAEASDTSSTDSEADPKPAKSSTPAYTVLELYWKDEDPVLSLEFVVQIMQDKLIKQVLFPLCGLNAQTKEGGGITKVTAHWNLMATIMRDYSAEIGETGAGITSAAEVDSSKTNAFTTKWAEIKASCPWFFDMCNLIAQHPNLILTGLGDNSTEVKLAAIIPPSTAVSGEDEPEEEEDVKDGSISGRISWSASPGHITEPCNCKRTFSDIESMTCGDNYKPSSQA